MTRSSLTILFEPILGWPLVWVCLALAIILTIALVLLRVRGGWLRGLAAFALAGALANPVISDEERSEIPATVAVIVDKSQSQKIGERAAQSEAALAALTQSIERSGRFDLRVVEAETGGSGGNARTELFSALRSAFRDVPPARVGGAIFLTDGQVHDVPESTENIGINAPIHALITGKPDEYDRQIRMVEAPRFAIVNTPVEMRYQVLDSGPVPDTGTVDVEIYLNGQLQQIVPGIPGETLPFDIALDRGGANIVELAIPTVDGELTNTNNRTIVQIEGIRENLRVLLVSGEPHSGERTWRNLLKSDASVDLVHFTILRPPEKQDGTPINELSLIAFPTRELFVEKIEDFDLIIFDRYQNRNVLPLLYYDYIAQYVANGGALLIASGPEFAGINSVAETPLASTLPAMPNGQIIEKAFFPRLTEEGKRHPVTRDLEGGTSEPPLWGRWFRTVGVTQPEGRVVMQAAEGNPLLVLNTYGEGRVGMMLSDHGWLWARGFEGGGPHVNLYRRMAHWLMKEPELEEEALTASSGDGRLVVTRQTMQAEVGPLQAILPSGEQVRTDMAEISEGRFEAIIETNEIGLVRLANDDLTALAHLGRVDSPEFRDMISTADIIAPAIANTGGAALRIANADGDLSTPAIRPIRSTVETSGDGWIGLRLSEETRLEGISRTSLFAGFIGLALLLAALSAMWFREGR